MNAFDDEFANCDRLLIELEDAFKEQEGLLFGLPRGARETARRQIAEGRAEAHRLEQRLAVLRRRAQ